MPEEHISPENIKNFHELTEVGGAAEQDRSGE